MASGRPYQLTVWGASGFTGRLICERLATEYPGRIRLALAGRSRDKLEAVRSELAKREPTFKDVAVVVAEADDRSAIDAITRASDVVLSCAGPYRLYSTTMLASCVANGAHYLDLAAETIWVRSNVNAYHDAAKEKGVKVVHFCGYGMLPMDMGTLMAVDAVRKRYKTGVRSVEQLVVAQVEMSAGSFASGLDIFGSCTPEERRSLDDPLCLTPDYLKGVSEATVPGLNYNAEEEAWLVTTGLTNVAMQCVYRSHALAKEPYGRPFAYTQGVRASNRIAAYLQSFGFWLFALAFDSPFLRSMLEKMQPPPGTGPSLKTQREDGRWSLVTVAYPEGEGAKPVTVRIADEQGDPGYWSTSKMAVECALSLILDGERVEQEAPCQGGVLTPALGLGLVPLHRLKESGFVVEVSI